MMGMLQTAILVKGITQKNSEGEGGDRSGNAMECLAAHLCLEFLKYLVSLGTFGLL